MHRLLHDIPLFLILFLEEFFLIFNQLLNIGSFGRRETRLSAENPCTVCMSQENHFFTLKCQFILCVCVRACVRVCVDVFLNVFVVGLLGFFFVVFVVVYIPSLFCHSLVDESMSCIL